MSESTKIWQRRVCELPDVDDLSNLEPGTEYVVESRTVVICPSCGRSGVKANVESGEETIVHARDKANGYMHDYCVSDPKFSPTAPQMITFNVQGQITGTYRPTTPKVETTKN